MSLEYFIHHIKKEEGKCCVFLSAQYQVIKHAIVIEYAPAGIALSFGHKYVTTSN